MSSYPYVLVATALFAPFSSKDTTNELLDRLTEGDNKTVMDWKDGVENLWQRNATAARRRSAAKMEPGLSLAIDNVGLVITLPCCIQNATL